MELTKIFLAAIYFTVLTLIFSWASIIFLKGILEINFLFFIDIIYSAIYIAISFALFAAIWHTVNKVSQSSIEKILKTWAQRQKSVLFLNTILLLIGFIYFSTDLFHFNFLYYLFDLPLVLGSVFRFLFSQTLVNTVNLPQINFILYPLPWFIFIYWLYLISQTIFWLIAKLNFYIKNK